MNDQAAGLRELVKQREMSRGKDTARIIAVASGKGGVGKTNITVNLGIALQKLGERVLLMDTDLGMANIDILLGLTPSYNLNHVLKGKCSFSEALVEGPEGIHILPGTSGIEDLLNISAQEVNRLLVASSQMEENYDIILLDIGAGAHQQVINFINAADEALIILTPEPPAIMDAYSLIKILSNHNFRSKLGLLINQINSRQEGIDVTNRMVKTIKDYLQLEVELMGYIPFDRHVQQSVKEQAALLSLYPDSKAGQAIRETAAKLIDHKLDDKSRGMKSFIYRMLGKFNFN